MNETQEKEYYKDFLENYIEKHCKRSKSKRLYNCPFCGSGTGPKGTGAFGVVRANSKVFKCLACNRTGDIYHLVAHMQGLDSFPEQMEYLRGLYGPYYANHENTVPVESKQGDDDMRAKAHNMPTCEIAEAHTELLRGDSAVSVKALKYLEQRKIDKDTINRFKIGCTVNNGMMAILLPTDTGYSLRNLTTQGPKYKQQGSKSIYKAFADVNQDVLLVVEGIFCALSLYQLGYNAIALQGLNAGDLSDLDLKNKLVILALDNDEHGKKAAKDLSKKLSLAGAMVKSFDYAIGIKDINEWYQEDLESLRSALSLIAVSPAETYTATSAGGRLNSIIKDLQTYAQLEKYPTGLAWLDCALYGGYAPGLHVIGALSGLGKTTLALQITDHIAAMGHHVLIFNLEMAERQLFAKSLSRLSVNDQTYITAGSMLSYNAAFNDLYSLDSFKSLCALYAQFSSRIWYTCKAGISAEDIRASIERHISFLHVRPFVLIDYLQIMHHQDMATDKQGLDDTLKKLKEISTEYNVPILLISSLNRASYQEDVSMRAFNGSANIEYSADTVIGLQAAKNSKNNVLAGSLSEPNGGYQRLKEINIHLLKNRFGPDNIKKLYSFFAEYGLYVPVDQTKTVLNSMPENIRKHYESFVYLGAQHKKQDELPF